MPEPANAGGFFGTVTMAIAQTLPPSPQRDAAIATINAAPGAERSGVMISDLDLGAPGI